MGEVDLDFNWAISPRKIIFIIINRKPWQKIPLLLPSRKCFSKVPQASSMLNQCRESKVALRFSSVGSRVTAIFNWNLTTWKEKIFEQFNLQKQFRPASFPLLGDGRKVFQSFLHSLWWAYALRQVYCLEIWQQTLLSRRWISDEERQDYRGMESNSSPLSRPEFIRKKVAPTTETCVIPSVR